MSPQTPTHPPNHRGMWRRLVSRAHPDAGGEHDLFIWTMATRDAICGGELGEDIPRRPRREQDPDPDRVPFDPDAYFEVLTDRAVTMAAAVAEPYGYLLRQLADCRRAGETITDNVSNETRNESRGASYKSLAAIGHRVGMSKPERVHWYRICEAVPLSQRHAGHILGKLQKEAA